MSPIDNQSPSTTLPPPPPPGLNAAAAVVGASKVYGSGDSAVFALDQVSVEFRKGEFTAIMGPSGSGKSTLMHCIAGLDELTSVDALNYIDDRLNGLGVPRLLARAGARDGAVIHIKEFSFEYIPEVRA